MNTCAVLLFINEWTPALGLAVGPLFNGLLVAISIGCGIAVAKAEGAVSKQSEGLW